MRRCQKGHKLQVRDGCKKGKNKREKKRTEIRTTNAHENKLRHGIANKKTLIKDFKNC